MTIERKQELVQEIILNAIVSETWNKEQGDNPEITTTENGSDKAVPSGTFD